jgi:hypothetical protein
MSIFKSNGTCIVSRPFYLKIAFSLARFPTGIYIVKINASDGNGNKQSMQIPVTIVN